MQEAFEDAFFDDTFLAFSFASFTVLTSLGFSTISGVFLLALLALLVWLSWLDWLDFSALDFALRTSTFYLSSLIACLSEDLREALDSWSLWDEEWDEFFLESLSYEESDLQDDLS